jgi:transcriptional regulator with XRE-family HTH domain
MRSQDARNRSSATTTRNLRRLLLAAMEEAASTDLVTVGSRIKQARTEAGLTQDELSDLVGVGLRQIQYYEAGESNPYRTLRRIAEATGRNVGWLLHGDPATAADEGAVEAVASIDHRLEELAAAVARLAAGQVLIADALGVQLDVPAPSQAQPSPRAARTTRKPA